MYSHDRIASLCSNIHGRLNNVLYSYSRDNVVSFTKDSRVKVGFYIILSIFPAFRVSDFPMHLLPVFTFLFTAALNGVAYFRDDERVET